MPKPRMIGPKPPCTVDGCLKVAVARGYCGAHWALWRKYGTPNGRPKHEVCVVENCDSSVRSTYSEHCELHYYRLRRSGTVAEPEYISGHCEIDGCEADATTNRAAIDGQKMYLCRLHYLRIQKRGDASFECRGENSPNWTGSEASSGAVHYRVRKARGPAASWSCVDCARPAEHWSDDHMDPNEKSDPEEGPYSLDIDHYFPRCVRCHKRFDLDYLARIEVAS